MTLAIEACHELSPNEIDAIEQHLYEHNSRVTGCDDARGLGFVICNELGQRVGVAAGYTWAATSELKQMWIDEPYRGRGYARALLDAFVEEARLRGVRRIWVASYDFQAPGMYEKAGFKRVAAFEGWPEGHINVILCRELPGGDAVPLKRSISSVGTTGCPEPARRQAQRGAPDRWDRRRRRQPAGLGTSHRALTRRSAA